VQPLALELTSNGDVEMLTVEGEIDAASASRLICTLNRSVSGAEQPLVIDLSRVGFMDSTGLALLINAHRRLMNRGKGFAVVCPMGPLRRVFEITDMVDLLRVCPDRESAARAAARA